MCICNKHTFMYWRIFCTMYFISISIAETQTNLQRHKRNKYGLTISHAPENILCTKNLNVSVHIYIELLWRLVNKKKRLLLSFSSKNAPIHGSLCTKYLSGCKSNEISNYNLSVPNTIHLLKCSKGRIDTIRHLHHLSVFFFCIFFFVNEHFAKLMWKVDSK